MARVCHVVLTFVDTSITLDGSGECRGVVVEKNALPVVVIGAGPQGLAAAAHLAERNVPAVVLEAGDGPAAAVAEWGHVRLFSGWPELIDAAGARVLAGTGWTAPATGYPTGAQWISGYLAPLAATLGDRIRYGARVVGVSRLGRDRLVDAGRGEQPFTVHVQPAEGEEYRLQARAVIDASGTWSTPNPAGADGLPALGETATADLLSYRIPDFRDRAGFEGKHTVVIGSGHSAITAVLALARMARRDPHTTVTWALRRATAGNAFGGGDADELPARGALGATAKEYVDAGLVSLVTGFRVERVTCEGERPVLIAEDGRTLTADRVVVLTGFRPDLSFLSELRLELDPTLQAPVRIAAEVDPNVHSCGSVAATGAADLAQPEPDFYLVGAKSYGRAPTFLALTGYEQVRSVVAELAGDHEAARRVELALPDTGVCGGAGLFDASGASLGGSCCAVPSQVLQIGRAPASV
ncbi:SidA/IucD/PvdA family monooxygenase [Microbacterium lushaniae]|nr:SidA/IucD/PvdA family monooxygenase [Microbacterium lushaniae]KAA9159277.1 SidA/IucD/PvdA family monooxygenase [Microbacterium lushaniae]